MTSFVVMGVAGCGKSTVGEALAAHFKLPFVEGDSLHDVSSVEKMSRGEALTDDDRWPWLQRVGQQLTQNTVPAVVSCSALRRVYRDHIRRYASFPAESIEAESTIASSSSASSLSVDSLSANSPATNSLAANSIAPNSQAPNSIAEETTAVAFIHLAAEQPVIAERMAKRAGHFMPPSLLNSQFETLEPLQSDESGTTIDISQTIEQVIADSVGYVEQLLAQD